MLIIGVFKTNPTLHHVQTMFNLGNNLWRSILKNDHITYFELHTPEINQFHLEQGAASRLHGGEPARVSGWK